MLRCNIGKFYNFMRMKSHNQEKKHEFYIVAS